MHTDALSDVLRAVRLSGAMFIRLRLSAPFSLDALDAGSLKQAFAPGADRVLPFHLVTDGPIWFNVDGEQAVELQSGDIIVLPHGSDHALSDVPSETALPVSAYHSKIAGSPATLVWDGPGPEARVLCGFFTCRERLFNPLLQSMPRLVVIRRDADRTAWLTSMIQRTYDEKLHDRRGGAALIEQMTSLLFMEVVQGYLDSKPANGWLMALSDPVVGVVLQLMHQEPARAWTVDELGRRAGVSRSALAERFGEQVGVSPIKYLTAWRMELAASRMLESGDSIAEIAYTVGYESESSFSKAFKRYAGDPPAHWRDENRPAAPAPAPS